MGADRPPTPDAPGERLRVSDEEVGALAKGVLSVTLYERLLAKEVQAHRAFWARVEAGNPALVERLASEAYNEARPITQKPWDQLDAESQNAFRWHDTRLLRALLRAASEAQS